eukprot:gb/GEZJ01000672.1/.p4 GENE.gb/GEZJ01000672.1/~~gb/GEZJ01000672.1/.p4  ORF type:complete len:223 (+),score=29.84 gb/GEZJ01000672.1/:4143-4811(+)
MAFLGMDPTPPNATVLGCVNATRMSFRDAEMERFVNNEGLQKKATALHPVVDHFLQKNRHNLRSRASNRKIPNFTNGCFVVVARGNFSAAQKPALRWRGPRRIVQALSNYVFQVEDLRNGSVEDICVTRLTFYHDASSDKEAQMAHVRSSETGMPLNRLLKLVAEKNDMFVHVRWKLLGKSEDILEPLVCMYTDVLEMVLKLLRRKNAPRDLVSKARKKLGL